MSKNLIILKILTLAYLLSQFMPSMQGLSGKMSPKCQNFVLNKENSSIIRAIILSKGREGCTLDEIKDGFYEQEGVRLKHPMGDYELQKAIEHIEYVKCVERHSTHYFYSNHPEQQHLIKLITQKHHRRNYYPSSNQKRGRTTSSPDQKRGRSTSSPKSNFKRTKTYTLLKKNDDAVPKPPPESSYPKECNESIVSNPPKECDKSIKNESVSTMSNASVSTFITEETMQHQQLHGCPVIGDNFFYTLAQLDLGFQIRESKNGFLQCGMTKNGMTIKMAQKMVEQEIESGKIIIVNIGSSDILNDRQLIELMEDMIHFLLTCKQKEVIPILTTLAPLPTFALGNRRDTLLNFNKFIAVNPFGYPVIDLYELFLNPHGKIDLHAFQPQTRKAHGSRQKILMWNRLGRKRVLDQLTDRMAVEIIKIYSQDKFSGQLKWHFY